ncbi:hypothetical protein JCM15124A_07230 [Prevotella falsenii]
MLKKEKIETYRIKFQQSPDGTPIKTEEKKNLERYFYDYQGRLAQSSKYNYTQDGKLQPPLNTVYVYDAQSRLLSDSTDRVKSCYFYNANGMLDYSTQYNYKSNLPRRIDSVVCAYDQSNRLASITHYKNKGEKNTEEQYTYDDKGRTASITYLSYSNGASTPKKQRQTIFAYNADDLLSETKLIRFTSTSEELQERKVFAYDEQKRLLCDTLYKKVTDPNGSSNFSLYQKHDYIYTLTDTIPSEVDEYRFNTTSQQFLQTYKFAYLNYLYKQERTPQASITAQEGTPGDIVFQVTPPADATGLQGYMVLADYTLQDELFTDVRFTLHNQPRGIHYYRVVPVYEQGTMGNCSELLTHTIKINLPAPTKPELVYKEYYTKWNVKFKFSAPQYQGLTLKGYRWAVSGNGHQTTGKTDSPNQLFGTFTYYNKEKVKVELYAVYEEGESDPLTFEIDLTDVTDMITEHWRNQYSTVKDETGNIKQTNKFYYTSDSMGETFSFSVGYDSSGQPKERTTTTLRKYSSKIESEEIDLYDPTKKNWEGHRKILYTYNSASSLSGKQVLVFNKDQQTFIKDKAEYYFMDPKVSYQYPIETTAYTFDTQGDSTVTAFTNSTLEFTGKYLSHQIDSVYASLDTTLPAVACIEKTFDDKGKIKTSVESRRINGKLTPHQRIQYDYSADTELPTRITHSAFRNNDWQTDSIEDFVASKEYHFTHMAKSLTLTKDSLRWKAPDRIQDLTGYKVLVNGIETAFADTCCWSAMSLPNGVYTFQVVPVYNDREAGISETLKIRYKNRTILADVAALRKAKPNVDYPYTLTGEVLVTGQAGANPAYTFFEDETSGIALDTKELAGYGIKVGDKIGKLKGKLVKEANGLLLFKPTYLSILSSGNAVTAKPSDFKTLLENTETLEARFIGLEGITFKQGDAGTMLISDADKELPILIPNDTDEQPVAGAKGNVEGFLSRSGEGFIFLPTRIFNVTGIQAISENEYPVVINGQLVLKQAQEIRVYDLQGSLLSVTNTNHIDLSAMPKGTILLQVYYKNGSKQAFKILH